MDLIVAVDQNWAIGKDGEQLLYLSQDLKRFKALTWATRSFWAAGPSLPFPADAP